MVKADPKHDYYADLELPSNADSETIKKQFRLLAKQYHPDRNPGKETEFISKFQAIQAANEILGDPTQKKSYDLERARQAREGVETHTSKKPPKPPPTAPGTSNFPPPPKRDPNLNRPFRTGNTRSTASASAEKFAQFTRAAPRQWDRAKFEDDAAKAETLRNLNNMRGQSQGPPPRVPPRNTAPTAPRPPSATASADVPHATGASPGFPGLSRTNSGRRGGFAPGTPVGDESSAPSSAYAHVHRSERPPPPPSAATYAYPQSYAKTGTPMSPSMQRARPSISPLRPSKSSGFEDAQRPGVQRSSSRFAANGGERIDVNGPGLTRSASVRNSPTGYRWDETGPFRGRPQSQQQQANYNAPPPRHHSSSPRGHPATGDFQYSASDTSSSDDEPPHNKARPKATPRRAQPPSKNNARSQSLKDPINDPALTGQFPSSNYNTKIHEENIYHYPPPEPNGAPHQRSSNNNANPVDDITQGLNNAGIRHVHRDDVPLKNQNSQRTNGTTSEPQSATTNNNSTFLAADWDDKFANGDSYFRPPESTSRSRSPAKQPRPKLPNRNRGANGSQNDRNDETNSKDETAPKTPGFRHVPGMADGLNKAAAFQAGTFSAEDWADKLRTQKNAKSPKLPPRDNATTSKPTTLQPEVHEEAEVEEHPSPHNLRPQKPTVAPDAMDIDDTVPNQTPSKLNTNSARKVFDTPSRQLSSSGINLQELKETAPFKPSGTGLSDLDDLKGSLPFKSRAAEDLNPHQPPSAGLAAAHFNFPMPPKPVPPPNEDHLTTEAWEKYAKKMTHYMDTWNIFNCKMIDHFRTRQAQIGLAMYHNWVTAVGDGASADDFDGLDFVGSESTRQDQAGGEVKTKKAGYATYMQWLEQDRVYRSWWDASIDEHQTCMEDLGRIRHRIKQIRREISSSNG